MPAYVIVFIEVTDPVKYETFKSMAPDAIAAGGGRYLVRGGEVTAIEGTHDGRRVVLLEFSSIEAAKAFHDTPAYRAAREMRKGAAKFTALLVPGVG
jgi:uncharacterized protein (DUF1330 family)